MWHWIKHWLGSAMADFPPTRSRPADQACHLRYEKGGMVLPAPPIPWNADGGIIELLVKLPPAARQRQDFLLRIPGQPACPAELLRRDESSDNRYRLFFRFPLPGTSTTAEILWRQRLLTTLPIPVQTAAEYTAGLRLTQPTVTVRIGGTSVAAQTFIAVQGYGLTAAAVVRSPTCLAPLADIGFRVVFSTDRGITQSIPVSLTGSQLAARETLVTASPGRFPRHGGQYTVTWMAGETVLHRHRLHAITSKRFLESLRLSDARFVIRDHKGVISVQRQASPLSEISALGPCFAVASREPGMAAEVNFEICPIDKGVALTPALSEQSVLVTDGPTIVAPGLIPLAEMGTISGFELRCQGQVVGILSLNPVPIASFTAEGGFKPPPDFAWSSAAEDELADKLGKLFGSEDLTSGDTP